MVATKDFFSLLPRYLMIGKDDPPRFFGLNEPLWFVLRVGAQVFGLIDLIRFVRRIEAARVHQPSIAWTVE